LQQGDLLLCHKVIIYPLESFDRHTSCQTTVICAIHEDSTTAPLNLKEHLHIIEKWLKKWKIKGDESKSLHITFVLRKGHCPAVNINQTIIPQTEAVKYLGLYRSADKSLARPGRKQATATENFDVHISYLLSYLEEF